VALYYRHVAKLFEDRGVEEPIVRFGKLALQSTSEGDESVKDIWTKVFLASMSTGAFDEAYVTLTSTPHPEL
jgi:nuclear pore complex protein Nup160